MAVDPLDPGTGDLEDAIVSKSYECWPHGLTKIARAIGHKYSEARFFGLFRVIFWTLILRNLSLDSASIGLVPHRIDSFNSQFILVEIQ